MTSVIRPIALVFDGQGGLDALSNDYLHPFTIDDMEWKSVEHFYQAQKFSDAGDREQVRQCKTGPEVRSLVWGELYERVDASWDDIRIDAMKKALSAKFFQDSHAREVLLASWPFPLAEDSLTDGFWGIGADGLGQNWLGRLLTDLRLEILRLDVDAVRFALACRMEHSADSRVVAAHFEQYEIQRVSIPIACGKLGQSTILGSIADFVVNEIQLTEVVSGQAKPPNSAIGMKPVLLELTQTLSESPKWSAARRRAFDKKYSRYLWSEDARSLIPNWVENFFTLMEQVSNAKLADAQILVVGAGAGEEAAYVWSKFPGRVTLTDIGEMLVRNCISQCPSANAFRADAESMHDVEAGTADIYCGLRTFQSFAFDSEAALREAKRVLRPGGLLLISISDAYKSDQNELVRGQIVGDQIDLTAALTKLCSISDTAMQLGFQSPGFCSLATELVVYAYAPMTA